MEKVELYVEGLLKLSNLKKEQTRIKPRWLMGLTIFLLLIQLPFDFVKQNQRHKKKNKPDHKQRIMQFGDSITELWGSDAHVIPLFS